MNKLAFRIVLLSLLSLTVFSYRAFGQSTSASTGHSYFGADLGLTYNWYSGQSNFFWPITGTDANGASVSTIAAFNGLGSGAGFLFGMKGGLALSNSVDLEGKLRYLTNYTSATENHTIPIILIGFNNPPTQEPVTNSYNLLLSNLDLDLLAHYALSERWYAAGGLSFSGLLSNRLYVNQTKNGGDNWSYYNRNNGQLSGDTEITVPNTSQQNFFSSTRAGVVLGGGTVFPLGGGSTLLDAELLLSIPLTAWLQSGAENTFNQASTTFGVPSVTFPKLWYASLTIGIRFPFGGNSNASNAEAEESNTPSSNPAIGSDGKVALTGSVTDAKTGDPVDANMTVVDLTNNQVVATDHTDRNGNYSVRVKAPGKYSVTADANGHLFGTAYFEVDPEGRILARHPDIKLSSANGRTRLLVFYEFNSSDLNASSYPELDRAVRLMKAVPSMRVEIAGYSDSIGNAQYNLDLSNRRASAVRDYLLHNGIDKSRVTAHGYGKDSPIADNGTEEGRAENRRVEFVVLK